MKKQVFLLAGITISSCIVFTAFTGVNTDKKLTREELGKQLFFDPILSKDSTISCASCHKPEFAFADNIAFSIGINGQFTGRNTPTAMNMGDRAHYFFDGRAKTLEEQALGPITNPAEMGADLSVIVDKLKKHKAYNYSFKLLYHSAPTPELLGNAIAAYERTLETGNTPFDRSMNNKANGMSESAKRGRKIFIGKGKCFDCHFGPDFTQDDFRNIGLYNGNKLNDKGRYDKTKNEADIGKFKVPGLRNIAITAPYMHNGMFNTLREVIDYYDNPQKFVPDALNKDSLLLNPLNLTEEEKNDLENFLRALTDDRFINQ